MPLRLAFSAWAMRELPVERQIQIVSQAGYVGICLVSDARWSQLDAVTASQAERRRIRSLLDDHGLALTAIAGHASVLDSRAEAIQRLRAGLDLAADLAGPTGTPPPLVSMAYGTPESYLSDRQAVADAFAEVADYARQRGGTLALEPHVGQAFDTPEKVVWLMQQVNSPHFRLNLDNSHFEVIGRDLEEYVPLLVPYAVHTDLKDQRGRAPEHEFLVPGEGDFSYARYMRALDRAGYDGYLSVEISVMVQRRPDYDPAEVAARSFRVVVDAAREADVPLEYRDPVAARA
jgi:sugar phosphate isomerase/epimerase